MSSFVTGIFEGQKEKEKATTMNARAMPFTIVPKGSGIKNLNTKLTDKRSDATNHANQKANSLCG